MVIVKFPVICLYLAFVTSPVAAQEKDPVQDVQPRFNQLIPIEDNETTWNLEALGFSHNLKLSEEASALVIREYTSSRVRLREAIRKAARGGDSDSPGRKGQVMGGNTALMLSQLMTMERVKLLENLRPALAEKQLEHAMLSLGSFSHDWDRMVHTITGFELSREKTLVALSPIEEFIAGMSDIQHRNGSRAEMQQQMQAHRKEFIMSMIDLLDDEQLKTFRQVADTVKIQHWQNTARNSRRDGTKRDSSSDPEPDTLPRKLVRYDANGDGKLTREELPEFLHKLLDQLDANKDDILDAEELKEFKARNG